MSYDTLITGAFEIHPTEIENFKREVSEYDFNRHDLPYFKNIYNNAYNKGTSWLIALPFAGGYDFNKNDFEDWLVLFEDFIKGLSYLTVTVYAEIENYGDIRINYVKLSKTDIPQKQIHTIKYKKVDKLPGDPIGSYN